MSLASSEKLENQLLEVVSNEEFLAYFSFLAPMNGAFSLEGLCKVACPSGAEETVNYLSLTFIIDTPTQESRTQSELLISKLTLHFFQKELADVKYLGSLPYTGKESENYVHQVDLLFRTPLPKDIEPLISRIACLVGQATGIRVDGIQWWSENDIPPRTQAETANLGSRVKSFLRHLF